MRGNEVFHLGRLLCWPADMLCKYLVPCRKKRSKHLKNLFTVFLLLAITGMIFVCTFDPYLQEPYIPKNVSEYMQVYPGVNEVCRKRNNSVVNIFFWTKFFELYIGWEHFHGRFYQFPCNYKCEFFHNRTLFNTSDVVLFSERDLYNHQNDLPTWKSYCQSWVIHSAEAPWYVFSDLKKYRNIFNRTSFMRKDSDIPLFYSRLVEKSLLTEKELHQVVPLLKLDKKKKYAAWMASNCGSHNGREHYILSLSKYIQVEMYGKCGTRKCDHNSASCDKLLNSHMFYISFENANCKDYVTEKFWRAFRIGAIPVVLGGKGNYPKVAPLGSYIDSADFSSPKELALYLKKVYSNETLYNSYFEWRESYVLVEDYWCQFCTAAHKWVFDKQSHRQSYKDLSKWLQKDQCKIWSDYGKGLEIIKHAWFLIRKRIGL